jgi:hypothetical protein
MAVRLDLHTRTFTVQMRDYELEAALAPGSMEDLAGALRAHKATLEADPHSRMQIQPPEFPGHGWYTGEGHSIWHAADGRAFGMPHDELIGIIRQMILLMYGFAPN